MERFENLDILINNAATAPLASLETATRELFDEIFDVNIKATVFLTQKAIPYLEKTKGNIVNISGLITKLLHLRFWLLYSMSKAALDQFTKTVALEVAEKGIRVNSVSPGYCPTNLIKSVITTSQEQEVFNTNQAACHPLGKQNLSVEEIADSVLYLASERAKMITGIRLEVDRGRALSRK